MFTSANRDRDRGVRIMGEAFSRVKRNLIRSLWACLLVAVAATAGPGGGGGGGRTGAPPAGRRPPEPAIVTPAVAGPTEPAVVTTAQADVAQKAAWSAPLPFRVPTGFVAERV